MKKIDWAKEQILFVANGIPEEADTLDPTKLRQKIEPWLTSLFQSDHLSLLVGAGIPYAIHNLATGSLPAGMSDQGFKFFAKAIEERASESARLAGRGTPNFEDRIRVANEIACGHCCPVFDIKS